MNIQILRTMAILTISVLLAAGLAPQSLADPDIVLSAGDNIQAALDAASPGDEIELGPGEYHQSFTITKDGISITGQPGAILDGHGPADDGTTLGVDAIVINADNIQITGLEIRHYTGTVCVEGPPVELCGGQGNAIMSWDLASNDVVIEDNYFHDNSWNGVLVGGEGGIIHTDYVVKNNRVDDNGFVGIELTNCSDCTVESNSLSGNDLGVVIQARNTIPGSGLVSIEDVTVQDNTISDSPTAGIYVLSYTGLTGFPFSPIAGASTLLTKVITKSNTLTDNSISILHWAFNAAATNQEGKIDDNTIDCPAGSPGILVLAAGIGPGITDSTEVTANSFDSDCSPTIFDTGTNTNIN